MICAECNRGWNGRRKYCFDCAPDQKAYYKLYQQTYSPAQPYKPPSEFRPEIISISTRSLLGLREDKLVRAINLLLQGV